MTQKHRGHKTKPKAPNNKPRRTDAEADDYPASRPKRVKGNHGTSDKEDIRPKKLVKRKAGLLSNEKEVKEDCKLIERAIRERWDIRNKGKLQRRLLDVVNKPTVEVLTKFGTFDSEAQADANAIAATKVLVQMNAQDQADDEFAIKQANPTTGATVNVNLNTAESGRSRILQLAQRLGARELVIDGTAIRTTELVGQTVQPGRIQAGPSEQVE